jgi:putative phage-type endonuclease
VSDLTDLGNAGTPEERRTGIGGSDAAAALGLSPWQTPYDLWEEKLGLAPAVEQTEPMLWGKLLEDIVRREYARRTGAAPVYSTELIRHPKHPFMFTHLDGDMRPLRGAILEVKTARTAQDWGEAGSDEIPMQYLVQIHHALAVTGAEVCEVAALFGGQDFRLYEVARDLAIEQQIIEHETAFWDHVVTRNPPGPSTLADAVKRWGRFDARGYVVADDGAIACVDTLRETHRLKAEIKQREEGAKTALMEMLGENGQTLVHPFTGEILATWKLDNGRKGYSVAPSEPSRRFRVMDAEDA